MAGYSLLKPKTFVVVVFFFPGGTATAFALTTCTAASIRETDDPTNWAIGGAASAVFMGLASKFLCNLMLVSYSTVHRVSVDLGHLEH